MNSSGSTEIFACPFFGERKDVSPKSFLPAGCTLGAGPNIAVCFLCLSVCLHLLCEQYYVTTYMQL